MFKEFECLSLSRVLEEVVRRRVPRGSPARLLLAIALSFIGSCQAEPRYPNINNGADDDGCGRQSNGVKPNKPNNPKTNCAYYTRVKLPNGHLECRIAQYDDCTGCYNQVFMPEPGQCYGSCVPLPAVCTQPAGESLPECYPTATVAEAKAYYQKCWPEKY